MRLVILQPGYLPWLGFFDQLAKADLFVYYDDVQYDKGGWRNRNRIKSPTGPQWLTVPVITKGHFGQRLNEVEVDLRSPWWKKHAGALRQNYQKTPFYKEYSDHLESILEKGHKLLVDLDLDLCAELARILGIGTNTVLSSQLGILDDDPTERLLRICKHFSADRYLTGDSAEEYLDEERFAREGITVEYQKYRHPEYRQLQGAFIPYLSVVDLLFNHGQESLGILTGKKTA